LIFSDIKLICAINGENSLGLKTDFFAFPWKGLHLKCYGIFPNVQFHKRPLPKSVLAVVHGGPLSPSKPQCSPSPINCSSA